MLLAWPITRKHCEYLHPQRTPGFLRFLNKLIIEGIKQIHFSDSIAMSKTEVPKTCILSEDHQMAIAVLKERFPAELWAQSLIQFLMFFFKPIL